MILDSMEEKSASVGLEWLPKSILGLICDRIPRRHDRRLKISPTCLNMNSKSNPHNLAIVLTGTIIPNTALHTQHLDPEARRQEYLNAIHFYRNFAPVYFLENSTYDLKGDRAFNDIPNVTVHRFKTSSPSKGKGFQEFEMLDQWMKLEPNLPERWIKVTGRYIYLDFYEILNECIRNQDIPLIINQYLFANHSDTALFCVETNYYRNNISGLYRLCDDSQSFLIEKVLNTKLKQLSKKDFKRFLSHLHCEGVAGHTGKSLRNRWIDGLNSRIRDVNYWIDRHYIWLSF
jgi:hypothetical protein